MKKILSTICLCTFITSTLSPSFCSAQVTEKYFTVTAYYSPLPNQSIYLKWDYENEKILNGEWLKWASGKKVFSGMLAAPKWYDFGTKIYLDGLGVWSVEDRGWAIVEAWKRGHKNDRIDIWVWYGDEGLKRALAWGKRVVKWKILEDEQDPSIDIQKFYVPKNISLSVTNSAFGYGQKIFYTSVWKDSLKSDIVELQKILQKSSLYKGKIDGVYSTEMINLIANFQKENAIIKTFDDDGVGYWGLKTRKKFASLYNSWVFTKNTTLTVAKDIFSISLYQQSNEEDIKNLQKVLQDLSLYTGKIDGKYSSIEKVLVVFQIEKKIIKKKTDSVAGIFGPKTRNELKILYQAYLDEKAKEDAYKALVAQAEKDSTSTAQKLVASIWNIHFGQKGKNVRDLQIMLKDLGYYEYKDTGIFGKITKESIKQYQLDNEIIKSGSDANAGIIGPATKESLTEDVAAALLDESLKDVVDPNKKQGNMVAYNDNIN